MVSHLLQFIIILNILISFQLFFHHHSPLLLWKRVSPLQNHSEALISMFPIGRHLTQIFPLILIQNKILHTAMPVPLVVYS